MVELTSSHMVYFVLNEEVYQGHKSSEERTSEQLAVLQSCWVSGAQCKAADCPGKSCHQIRDHEDIMPIVIIGGSHICPSTTCQCSEDAYAGDEFGER